MLATLAGWECEREDVGCHHRGGCPLQWALHAMIGRSENRFVGIMTTNNNRFLASESVMTDE